MSKQQRRTTAVVFAAAGLAALILAAPAQADPIRFDNPAGPGHFVWYGGGGTGIGLNVTLDAASQTGAPPGSPVPIFNQIEGSTSKTVAGYATGYDLQVAGSPARFLVGVDYLDPIPSGYAWRYSGWMHHNNYPDQTQLPVGVETYLGLHFPLEDGTHNGWIGVVMDSSYNLDAFAWGYETAPGVPIAAGVPEPGTLALLALGVMAALRRRRA
jgi:hypothetical protein